MLKTKKSYSGYVFYLANAPISWEAKKQQSVALSSTEAELVSLSEAAREACSLGNLYHEMFNEKLNVLLFNDSQSAGKLAKNEKFHNRTKHMERREYFIRDVIKKGKLELKYLNTHEMTADVFTKALPPCKHKTFMNQLLNE